MVCVGCAAAAACVQSVEIVNKCDHGEMGIDIVLFTVCCVRRNTGYLATKPPSVTGPLSKLRISP